MRLSARRPARPPGCHGGYLAGARGGSAGGSTRLRLRPDLFPAAAWKNLRAASAGVEEPAQPSRARRARDASPPPPPPDVSSKFEAWRAKRGTFHFSLFTVV